MSTACTCTNYQLREVGCECAANVNCAAHELDRRYAAEQAAAEAAAQEWQAEKYRQEWGHYPNGREV